nr:MAG TPA: hypothetical protein [Caudoviricetes sp.]DAQ17790.1 MAG TPA: hypothetical protein [Crassvirales sp.]
MGGTYKKFDENNFQIIRQGFRKPWNPCLILSFAPLASLIYSRRSNYR